MSWVLDCSVRKRLKVARVDGGIRRDGKERKVIGGRNEKLTERQWRGTEELMKTLVAKQVPLGACTENENKKLVFEDGAKGKLKVESRERDRNTATRPATSCPRSW